MADIENGDILRIGATWQYEGTYEVTNVWHVKVTAGGGIDYPAASLDIQDYMEAIYNDIDGALANDMITDYLTLANMTQLTTFGAFAWQNQLQGTLADALLAPGVCCFAWARTLKPRVQIRKYFGCYTIGNLLNGLFTAATLASVEAAMTTHIQSYALGPALTMIGVAYNRTLLTSTEAISVSSRAEPAYQRRRKRGSGS